jgi:hypothetical protein
MLFSVSLLLASATLGASRLSTPRAITSAATSGRYIVKLTDHMSTMSITQMKASLINKPSHNYNMDGFRGFAGSLTAQEKQMLEASNLVYIMSGCLTGLANIITRPSTSKKMQYIAPYPPSNKKTPHGALHAYLPARPTVRHTYTMTVQAKEHARTL